MKRITKKRLAEMRETATIRAKNKFPFTTTSPRELLALLDAYERKPDEVAEGWGDGRGKVVEADDRSPAPPCIISGLTLHSKPHKDLDVSRHVRVEVYYLPAKTKRGRR